MLSDSDLMAHLEYGTGGTVGADAFADVLAKRDEQAVDLDPITLWKLFLQFDHGLFGSAGMHIAPTIDDAMDVDIDADAPLAASHAKW